MSGKDLSEVADFSVSHYLESRLLKKLIEQLRKSNDSSSDLTENRQEQDDEIVALESIYTGQLQRFNLKDANHCSFMLSIHVAITEPIEVTMQIDETTYSFILEHLPPFHLAWTYPSTYPSSSPPLFVLHCSWLSRKKLIQLTERMGQLWDGKVVVYQWAEFLQTQLLDCIALSNKLLLEELEASDNESIEQSILNIVSESTLREDTALTLMRYNEVMQLETFRNSLHLCEICFTEHAGINFIKLPCDHVYCRSCMQQYTSIAVMDGSVSRLKCPKAKCNGAIPPFTLKELLKEEAFERWEKLCLERTLDAMADVVYCPRCHIACIEDTVEKDAQCSKCLYSFCTLCYSPRHISQKCMLLEDQLAVLQDSKLSSKEKHRKAENMKNEVMNLEAIKRETVPCPSCKMAIVKTESCNKVVCSNCNRCFCYRCGSAIEGHDHFSGEFSCKLFTPTQVDQDLDDKQKQHRRGEQVLKQIEGHPAKRCPACRQPNTKQGKNNHICCWSCQTNFCGSCLEVVKRFADHYGLNKCKQHS